MNTIPARESCWPNAEQELLLRAALLNGTDAVAAWRQWKRNADINHIDAGSYRLLPMLYRNLRVEGHDDALMGVLKGVYRNAWYKNHLLFHHAARILDSFRKAGIETIVLKGIALTRLYYRDMGLRYMDDVDLLVRPGQAADAIEILRKGGWRPSNQSPEALLGYEHAVEFRDQSERMVDLHWRVMWDGRPGVSDIDFWEAAVPLRIGNSETLALNPSDQLFHCCVHGANWNAVPPLRWVADATMIMRASKSINWDRLIEQAHKRQLIVVMRETLDYLRTLLDAPVPASVLQALRDAPVSRREKLFFQIRATHSHPSLRRFTVLWHWYESFRLASANASFAARLVDFGKYLQSLWGVEHLWKIPLHVAYKAFRAVTSVPYSYALGRFRRDRSA